MSKSKTVADAHQLRESLQMQVRHNEQLNVVLSKLTNDYKRSSRFSNELRIRLDKVKAKELTPAQFIKMTETSLTTYLDSTKRSKLKPKD